MLVACADERPDKGVRGSHAHCQGVAEAQKFAATSQPFDREESGASSEHRQLLVHRLLDLRELLLQSVPGRLSSTASTLPPTCTTNSSAMLHRASLRRELRWTAQYRCALGYSIGKFAQQRSCEDVICRCGEGAPRAWAILSRSLRRVSVMPVDRHRWYLHVGYWRGRCGKHQRFAELHDVAGTRMIDTSKLSVRPDLRRQDLPWFRDQMVKTDKSDLQNIFSGRR